MSLSYTELRDKLDHFISTNPDRANDKVRVLLSIQQGWLTFNDFMPVTGTLTIEGDFKPECQEHSNGR